MYVDINMRGSGIVELGESKVLRKKEIVAI